MSLPVKCWWAFFIFIQNTTIMKICAISDTHGILNYIKVDQQCDVLVIAGDFSPLKLQEAVSEKEKTNTMKWWIRNVFIDWLLHIPANQIIFTPGNHDFVTGMIWFKEWINGVLYEMGIHDRIHYICNEQITIDGVTFWGCPYSDLPGWAWYSGCNPELYTPPKDTDVMIVHAAPNYGGLGETINRWGHTANYGSDYLVNALAGCLNLPKLLICGHIHSGQHKPQLYTRTIEVLEQPAPNVKGLVKKKKKQKCVMVNVSIKDEGYNEYYTPATIDYDCTPDRISSAITVKHIRYDELEDINTFILNR